MADMQELIARLEAAEVGGRELDVALAWHRWVEPKMWGSTNAKGEPVWKVERDGKRVPLPDYTTSLDAALALAERALPSWRVFGISDERDFQVNSGWGAGICELRGSGIQHARSSTPALALCISILRAIQHGYEAAGEVSPNLKAKAQGEGG